MGIEYDFEALIYNIDPDRDKEPDIEYQFSNGREFEGGPARGDYED